MQGSEANWHRAAQRAITKRPRYHGMLRVHFQFSKPTSSASPRWQELRQELLFCIILLLKFYHQPRLSMTIAAYGRRTKFHHYSLWRHHNRPPIKNRLWWRGRKTAHIKHYNRFSLSSTFLMPLFCNFWRGKGDTQTSNLRGKYWKG